MNSRKQKSEVKRRPSMKQLTRTVIAQHTNLTILQSHFHIWARHWMRSLTDCDKCRENWK